MGCCKLFAPCARLGAGVTTVEWESGACRAFAIETGSSVPNQIRSEPASADPVSCMSRVRLPESMSFRYRRVPIRSWTRVPDCERLVVIDDIADEPMPRVRGCDGPVVGALEDTAVMSGRVERKVQLVECRG
jgi:hypothetical protein